MRFITTGLTPNARTVDSFSIKQLRVGGYYISERLIPSNAQTIFFTENSLLQAGKLLLRFLDFFHLTVQKKMGSLIFNSCNNFAHI